MTRATFACPKCRQHLRRASYDGHLVRICPKCSGLWCQSYDWNVEDFGELPPQVPIQYGNAVHVPRGRRHARCPKCPVPLHRWTLPDPNRLQLDYCQKCRGVWFDHNEWDKLAAVRSWQDFSERSQRPTSWLQWATQFVLSLPAEFNVRPRRPAVVTWAIIALCCLVFVAEQYVDLSGLASQPQQALTLQWFVGLLTYQFMHASVIHLVGNMYLLYILGDNIEDVLGHRRFLAFYLTAGALAAVPHTWFDYAIAEDSSLVGASGAISAVIAAYALIFREAKLTMMIFFRQYKFSAPGWLTLWFLAQVFGAITDPTAQTTHVASSAHVTGFIMGVLFIYPQRTRLIAQNPLLSVLAAHRETTTQASTTPSASPEVGTSARSGRRSTRITQAQGKQP